MATTQPTPETRQLVVKNDHLIIIYPSFIYVKSHFLPRSDAFQGQSEQLLFYFTHGEGSYDQWC